MSYVTQVELVEMVPDLRAMAIVETSAEVRAALNRLADRYARDGGRMPECRAGLLGSRSLGPASRRLPATGASRGSRAVGMEVSGAAGSARAVQHDNRGRPPRFQVGRRA